MTAKDNGAFNKEQKHVELILRYVDVRAFMRGLKAALPERRVDILEEILKDTETSTRKSGNLDKEIKALELSISSLEYFLLGFKESLTGDHKPAVLRLLESSDNAAIVAAALGTRS